MSALKHKRALLSMIHRTHTLVGYFEGRAVGKNVGVVVGTSVGSCDGSAVGSCMPNKWQYGLVLVKKKFCSKKGLFKKNSSSICTATLEKPHIALF